MRHSNPCPRPEYFASPRLPGGWLLALALVLTSVGGPGAARAGDPALPADKQLDVALLGGVFRGDTPEEAAANLAVHTQQRGGEWELAWGVAHGVSKGLHYGLVRDAQLSAHQIRLTLEIMLGDDPWGRGGRGRYDIELARRPEGDFEGTYTGTYKGQPVRGRATARLRPAAPVVVANFQPLTPGEHPRMLFRRGDLPALREKLKTPFGQAYLKRATAAGDLISRGMLYQLTGDQAAAADALKIAQGHVAKGEVNVNPAGSGSTGHRLVEMAFAYDLMYDAWPAEFRDKLAAAMLDVIKAHQRRIHPGHANYHPASNYYGPHHGSAALAAMAIWQEKGPRPPEPATSFNVRNDDASVAPAAEYKPGKAVPVAKFASGTMPAEWLFAGGLKPTADGQPRVAPGGAVTGWPESGTRISDGERSAIFQPIPHEEDKGYWSNPTWTKGRQAIDLTNVIGRAYNTTTWFFAVIDNDAPRWVRLTTEQDAAEVYLAGARLRHGDVVRLDRGLYPLLVAAPLGEVAKHARILVEPRLTELSASAAVTEIAERRAVYRFLHDLWQRQAKAWETSGGVDPVKDFYMRASRARCYWHYRANIGDGGFLAEAGPAYSGIGAWYPVVYAAAHRVAFGRDVANHPDVSHLAARRLMQIVLRDDGSQLYQSLNSGAGFEVGWPWTAASYPLIPETYKPFVLWAWQRVGGVRDAASAERLLGDAKGNSQSGLHLAQTLLHYPLDAAAKPPAQGMPLTWQASDFGLSVFRSGWQGSDEFVGQVFLKAKPVMGWNHGNAGTFRLMGLGREWVTGPTARNGARAQEPVVWLRDDELNEGGCGRLTALTTKTDGSGSLAIDLGDVYLPAGAKHTLYDANLIRLAERVQGEISGSRAIAFDFSGRCGAPCLMAMVDQVRGGKSKEWLWQIPDVATGKGKTATTQSPKVAIDGQSFTLSYEDASLRATFLAPAGVKLEAGIEDVQVRDARHGFHGKINRVRATGGDEFFVVVTVQRGEAPAVKTAGSGLGATATVGKQMVRFDGEKLVVEP